MPSLADINKRDETASKPDAGKYGLEPFLAGNGFALVACCPIYTVVGIVAGIVHQVKKRRTKKAGEQEAGEKTPTTGNDHSGADAMRRKKKPEDSTSLGLKRATSPSRVTHGFKGDPDDPRICHPECPGYGKDDCAVHRKSDPDRPTSPGLLAV
ncbi:hypothetical protein LA080_009038 [Diaporthe eres]|nr:hypothetical protein LA080_009038 [Diaporthe eres]